MANRRQPPGAMELRGSRRKQREIMATEGEIGGPPEWFDEQMAVIWHEYISQIVVPLGRNDRPQLEMACTLKAKLRSGELPIAGFSLLRLIENSFGCSPKAIMTFPAEENKLARSKEEPHANPFLELYLNHPAPGAEYLAHKAAVEAATPEYRELFAEKIANRATERMMRQAADETREIRKAMGPRRGPRKP